MRNYIISRLLGMIPTLVLISVVVFVVIQLPPGDIVTSTLDRMQAQGVEVSAEQVQNLRAQYNLDDPLWLQYLYWAANFVTGDMGYSYLFARPVNDHTIFPPRNKNKCGVDVTFMLFAVVANTGSLSPTTHPTTATDVGR